MTHDGSTFNFFECFVLALLVPVMLARCLLTAFVKMILLPVACVLASIAAFQSKKSDFLYTCQDCHIYYEGWNELTLSQWRWCRDVTAVRWYFFRVLRPIAASRGAICDRCAVMKGSAQIFPFPGIFKELVAFVTSPLLIFHSLSLISEDASFLSCRDSSACCWQGG